MALTDDIVINGAAELERQLLQFTDKVRKRVLVKAMRMAMLPIHSAAIRNVPTDTGALAATIRMGPVKTRGGTLTTAVIAGGEGGHLFKGKAYYAGWVEFGHFAGKRDRAIERTVRRLRKGRRSFGGDLSVTEAKDVRLATGEKRSFVPAQPFLRPAYDEKKGDAVAVLEREVGAGLEREWAKVASVTGAAK